MITDSWFTAGNDKMVKLMLENDVRTYMYVLNYTIQGLNLPEWIGMYWATNKGSQKIIVIPYNRENYIS
jgi:hypothetical protein